jgi:hypothetical protein
MRDILQQILKYNFTENACCEPGEKFWKDSWAE